MSTGPGKTQRAILKALQGTDIHGLEMGEVARCLRRHLDRSAAEQHRPGRSEPGAARFGVDLLGRRREDSGERMWPRTRASAYGSAELRCPSEATGCPQIAQQGPRVGVLWHCPHAQVFDHGPPLVLDHAAMVTADSISEN